MPRWDIPQAVKDAAEGIVNATVPEGADTNKKGEPVWTEDAVLRSMTVGEHTFKSNGEVGIKVSLMWSIVGGTNDGVAAWQSMFVNPNAFTVEEEHPHDRMNSITFRQLVDIAKAANYTLDLSDGTEGIEQMAAEIAGLEHPVRMVAQTYQDRTRATVEGLAWQR